MKVGSHHTHFDNVTESEDPAICALDTSCIHHRLYSGSFCGEQLCTNCSNLMKITFDSVNLAYRIYTVQYTLWRHSKHPEPEKLFLSATRSL